jgi:hypothetical protein
MYYRGGYAKIVSQYSSPSTPAPASEPSFKMTVKMTASEPPFSKHDRKMNGTKQEFVTLWRVARTMDLK